MHISMANLYQTWSPWTWAINLTWNLVRERYETSYIHVTSDFPMLIYEIQFIVTNAQSMHGHLMKCHVCQYM